MNLYEKILILDPNLEDPAADEAIQKIIDVIVKQGGEALKTDKWGRRKLAYELNKHSKGNYVLLLFKAPPATIAELERFCKVTDAVIKFMVVKLTKKKQIEWALASLTETTEKAQPERVAPPVQATPAAETAAPVPEEKENVQ